MNTCKSGFILMMIGLFVITSAGCTPSPASTLAPLSTFTAVPFSSPLPSAFVFPSSTAALPTTISNKSVLITQLPATSIPPVQSTQVGPAAFCADLQVAALIDSFKNALQTSNGILLASLVSPVHGLAVRDHRNGTVVTYDQTHSKFLFDSTFQADWGLAPASGLDTKGSFHEVILPDLLNLFNKEYTLHCDQIEVGGTTYQAAWPYPAIPFYSAFYSGSRGSGSLDWQTWSIGMEYVNGQPYLYAIVPFQWEP